MARSWEDSGTFAHRGADSRILIVSTRGLTPFLARANLYEFENLAAELDQVDVFAPSAYGDLEGRRGAIAKTRRRIEEELARRTGRGDTEGAPYDLVLVFFQNMSDLERLRPLQRWTSLGRRSAALCQEIWETAIVPGRSDFERLNLFDQLFLTLSGSVEPLARALDTPVAELPFGVDAALFSPRGPGRPRTIDFYAMGRRHEGMHADLIAHARKEEFFYAYDSLRMTGRTLYNDVFEHRLLTSRMIQSTRFFAVNRGRFDTPDLIADQDEVNPRYYEGASAGATMVGAVPRGESFTRLMGWPDAVIPFDPESQKIVPFLQELAGQTERLESARRRGVRECLTRHDWMFRWRALLETLGLDEPPSLARREEELHKRAAPWGDPA